MQHKDLMVVVDKLRIGIGRKQIFQKRMGSTDRHTERQKSQPFGDPMMMAIHGQSRFAQVREVEHRRACFWTDPGKGFQPSAGIGNGHRTEKSQIQFAALAKNGVQHLFECAGLSAPAM